MQSSRWDGTVTSSLSPSTLSLSFSLPFTSRSHPASLSSSPPSCHLSPPTLYQPSPTPVPPEFKTVRSLFYRTRSFTDLPSPFRTFANPQASEVLAVSHPSTFLLLLHHSLPSSSLALPPCRETRAWSESPRGVVTKLKPYPHKSFVLLGEGKH